MSADWGVFDWEDPFHLNDQLTEEEILVKDTAASYASNKLAPRVIDSFRKEQTHREIFNEMGELGLLGSTIEGYGCPGRCTRTSQGTTHPSVRFVLLYFPT